MPLVHFSSSSSSSSFLAESVSVTPLALTFHTHSPRISPSSFSSTSLQSGVDVSTEIAAGELFDFDFEVAPLLEVLVGRTLEQAMAELTHEAEIDALRARREAFEAVRSAELAEVQRLEAEVERRAAEKARRKEQEAARLKREAEIREKIAAAAFARS
jgi:radial spoke head protein 3